MKQVHGNRLTMGILLSLSLIYSYTLYTGETAQTNTPPLSEEALKGQELWQQNNCIACHQIYGLGGYLGPDLTNIASNPKKGIEYAKAFFNSGIKAMPKFNFSEKEQNQLAEFLKEIDQTGYYPNKNAKIQPSGWVSIQYK